MAAAVPGPEAGDPRGRDRGEGVYLYDEDDRRYLDFTAGIGVTSTGHCHPRVVAAAQEQVGKLIHGQYTTVMHQPLLTLVERLGEVLPPGLDRMFFANSGSEAIEAALRLARQATGRPNVIVFHGGFHGRTVAAASMTTSGTKFRSGFAPAHGGRAGLALPRPGPLRVGPGGGHASSRCASSTTRCRPWRRRTTPPRSSWSPCSARAATCPRAPSSSPGSASAPTGTGSCSWWTRSRPAGDGPASSGAASTSTRRPTSSSPRRASPRGFPLSGIAASGALMEKAWPGSQGGTYGANAVACAAAIATLDVIQDERLVENAAVRGAQLKDALRGVADRFKQITDVRGLGLMIGNEFRDAEGQPSGALAAAAQQEAAERGLLLLTCGAWGQVVRFIPALVVGEQDVEEAAQIWSDAVGAVLG